LPALKAATRRFIAALFNGEMAVLTVRCHSCNSENSPAANFCGTCGERLAFQCPECKVYVPANASVCSHCSTSLVITKPYSTTEAKSSTGERRHLTVLFSDIVGSTALAGSLDPEDWRELVSAYQRTAVSAIVGFGGHVAQYLGDGLVIYFGYPMVQENAAESAVRAGLAILEAIASLNHALEAEGRPRLSIRIGIHSGSVVVGTGGDGKVEAFGDVPNVAARIQGVAGSDNVLISAATFRLVSGLFVTEELGARVLKGVPEPLELFRVIRGSGIRSRLHATAAIRGLTPFVGRESELDQLWEHWLRAHDGERQLVLISGEAGIGKSRLLQEFRRRLVGARHLWIECGASPFFQTTPFYPVIEAVRQTLGWSDQPSEDDFKQLERRLAQVGSTEHQVLIPMSRLLGLAVPPQLPQPVLPPEQERYRQMEAVVCLIATLAKQQPMVIVMEDLHWADASTLELLQMLSDEDSRLPLLVFCTARCEFDERWSVVPNRSRLMMGALSIAQAREMVENLSSDRTIADSLVNAVTERAIGVPLFIEELTRAVLEGDEGGCGIPPTLRDSLMARLDRLGDAKEIAQFGAALGHEFSYDLINAIAPLPEPRLQTMLTMLVEAGILYQSGTPPVSSYSFKHSLLRDVAYEALLRSRRREMHRAIVTVLVNHFPAAAQTQPGILAHHYAEAGEFERAAEAWQRAAKEAAEHGALLEAEQDYRRALELLEKVPQTHPHDQLELVLQLELGQVLITTHGYQAAQTAAAYDRARTLAERQADSKRTVQMLCGLFAVPLLRGQMAATQQLAEQVMLAARRDGSPVRLIWGHYLSGVANYHRGDLTNANQRFAEAFALYRSDDHRRDPLDPGAEALEYGSLAAWQLGMADTARARIREALALADQTGKPYAIAHSRFYAGFLYALLREPARTRKFAEAVVELTRERHFPHFFTAGKLLWGWALALQGEVAEGLVHAQQGFAEYAGSGNRLAIGMFLGLLAETQARVGAMDKALRTIDEALNASPDQLVDVPHLLWLRGKLKLQSAELSRGLPGVATLIDSAEQDFRSAIETALSIGARSYALRASISLARMLNSQSHYPEALTCVREVYGGLVEGFDTQEALEAIELLR
jgi:class 3 adenylate cyclase/tetratricopeptide (TPR) repeat protein